MLMCSCEKVDFNLTSPTIARLVFEAEQDNRNGGNSSNGRQLLSDTDMSLSEASFIVKTTLIIQVISSNLPLPAEWNYAEEKRVKEQCQKFREEILKIDRTFFFLRRAGK